MYAKDVVVFDFKRLTFYCRATCYVLHHDTEDNVTDKLYTTILDGIDESFRTQRFAVHISSLFLCVNSNTKQNFSLAKV